MGESSLSLRRGVFLDRDGVLNRAFIDPDGTPKPPSTIAELELLPGVEAACSDLRAAGFVLLMITNQPDVARGTQSLAVVEAMNRLVATRCGIDDVAICIHDDSDECECRKPKPGLIFAGAARQRIDLAASFVVGDRWRDIEAGRTAGCTTILVDSGRDEAVRCVPDRRAGSLVEGVSWILSFESRASAVMEELRGHHR